MSGYAIKKALRSISRKRALEQRLEDLGPAVKAVTDAYNESLKTMGGYKTRAQLAKSYGGGGLYTGHGGYNFKKAFLGKRGGMVMLGNAAKRAAASYLGGGAYTTANNLVASSGFTNSVPAVYGIPNETGDIILTHREYVTDIFGPTNSFNVQSYALNPGLDQTFPWLSQLAQNYEEYEFHQLVWEYRSTTTDIGTQTNGQCGTVIMATNYNASSPPFNEKASMMEYAHSMSCKTTEHMIHGVECVDAKVAGDMRKYVRNAPVVSGQDLKTYDHGLFQIAVANSPQGFQNNPIGELWVYYTVRLSKPKLFSALGKDVDKDVFMTPTTVARGAVMTGAAPFDANGMVGVYKGQQNSIGVLLTRSSDTVGKLTFPAAFTGAVEIKIITRCINAAAVGQQPALNAVIDTGNIAQIYDLHAQNGSPTYFHLGENVGVGTVGDVCSITHWYVAPASGGINNVLSVAASGYANTAVIYWYIEITRYNSVGLRTAADRLQWVSGTGQVVSADAV